MVLFKTFAAQYTGDIAALSVEAIFPFQSVFVCLSLSVFVGTDLFGSEPFDPFTCGAADFPPDIQSKLDEMQVSSCLCLIPPHCFKELQGGWLNCEAQVYCLSYYQHQHSQG